MALTPEQLASLDPRQVEEAFAAHRLADALLKNPKTKAKVQEALKDLNPNVSLPEYDITKSVDDKIAKLTETVTNFIKGQTDAKASDSFQQKWDSAKAKYAPGLTEDGEKKLHELMVERKIADPEAGMILWNTLNPPQETTASPGWATSTLFDPSPDTDLGEWFKNPDRKRDSEIAAVLAGR